MRVKKIRASSSKWSTGYKPVTECPYMKIGKLIVLVDFSLFEKISRLADEIDTEFLMYAKYKKLGENEIYVVDDVFVPKQKASATFVEVEDKIPEKFATETVVIHKHPPNIESFSRTDYEYINANNDVSLLWCDGEFTDATVRRKLPCGKTAIASADTVKMYVVLPTGKKVDKLIDGIKKWVEEAKKKIKQEYVHVANGKTILDYSDYGGWRTSLYDIPDYDDEIEELYNGEISRMMRRR